mmetsp:Transcript_25000/g.73124  ORF Transcript_25000/g.73124 Transcript_25000/m.73124 type:complete len:251 (-) Transcript_25000:4111-4863(-)
MEDISALSCSDAMWWPRLDSVPIRSTSDSRDWHLRAISSLSDERRALLSVRARTSSRREDSTVPSDFGSPSIRSLSLLSAGVTASESTSSSLSSSKSMPSSSSHPAPASKLSAAAELPKSVSAVSPTVSSPAGCSSSCAPNRAAAVSSARPPPDANRSCSRCTCDAFMPSMVSSSSPHRHRRLSFCSIASSRSASNRATSPCKRSISSLPPESSASLASRAASLASLATSAALLAALAALVASFAASSSA